MRDVCLRRLPWHFSQGVAPLLARLSIPVTGFIEGAFMEGEGDAEGLRLDLDLDGLEGMRGADRIGHVILRAKFHLQEDILHALAKGVGLDVASAARAADTLAATKLGIIPGSRGRPDETEVPRAPTDEKMSPDQRMRLMEREEGTRFRRMAPTAAAVAGASSPSKASSYASMTAGIKRFLSGQRSEATSADGAGTFVTLFKRCG